MSDVELLVIDNNSRDGTYRLVKELAVDFPRLRYVRESRQGLSHARNRALAEAAAPWVNMLDDDARVLPGYVDRVRELAGNQAFDCVGGVYEAWYPESRVHWFRDSFATNAGLSDRFGELPPDRFVSGGIMLLRRDLALAAGGFVPAVGMRGRGLGYGEETLLQIRMRERGGRIGFDPAWRIEHRVSPDKQSIGWQLRSSWAVGRDSWTALARHPSGKSLLRVVWRLLARPARGLAREAFACNQPRTWQTWLLAATKPLVMTTAELVRGVCLYLGLRERR